MTSEPTTTTHPDLRPATGEVARVVGDVRDDQLGGTTPCPDYPVAALLDHLMGLCVAFTCAARKEQMPTDGAESQQGAATADHLDHRGPALGPIGPRLAHAPTLSTARSAMSVRICIPSK